jgi:hypothetical protein
MKADSTTSLSGLSVEGVMDERADDRRRDLKPPARERFACDGSDRASDGHDDHQPGPARLRTARPRAW